MKHIPMSSKTCSRVSRAARGRPALRLALLLIVLAGWRPSPALAGPPRAALATTLSPPYTRPSGRPNRPPVDQRGVVVIPPARAGRLNGEKNNVRTQTRAGSLPN